VTIGDVAVAVILNNISVMKLNDTPPSGELTFDVGVRVEEKNRKSGEVSVAFVITIKTKPNSVKFGVEGLATLTGKEEDIDKLLKIDPDTKIPRVLQRIYQHSFMAIYLLSAVLESPYPPADLFSPSGQSIPNVDVLSGVNIEGNVETAPTAVSGTPTTETTNQEQTTVSGTPTTETTNQETAQ